MKKLKLTLPETNMILVHNHFVKSLETDMSPLELIEGRSLGLGIMIICPDIRWVKQIVTS